MPPLPVPRHPIPPQAASTVLTFASTTAFAPPAGHTLTPAPAAGPSHPDGNTSRPETHQRRDDYAPARRQPPDRAPPRAVEPASSSSRCWRELRTRSRRSSCTCAHSTSRPRSRSRSRGRFRSRTPSSSRGRTSACSPPPVPASARTRITTRRRWDGACAPPQCAVARTFGAAASYPLQLHTVFR